MPAAIRCGHGLHRCDQAAAFRDRAGPHHMSERNQPDSTRASIGVDPHMTGSVLRRMAAGSAWMVAARWSMRGIGVVSTIVLARLLTPADFGLIAMCAVMMGFVSVFAESGQDLAVIRHPDPRPEHFDTAWTMSVCAGTAVAVVLVAIAPLGGWYFHDQRVVPLVRFLALAPFIEGFTNVGVVAGFRRSLLFGKDFSFFVVRKLAIFLVTLPLALILRDYRALAVGMVVGRLLTVLASYRMHPYRPHLRLTTLGEIWSFSAWMQLAMVGEFLAGRIDQIIVGGLVGTPSMGAYNVAADLATAPTNETVIPTARALFPVYATLLKDPLRLARSYLDVLSLIAIIALSTGVGVALVADDMVLVVLGSKWIATVKLIPWLAIGGAVFGVTRSVNSVLSVTGNARVTAMRNWALVILAAPAMVVGGTGWGSAGVAAASMMATLLFAPVMFYSLVLVIPVTGGQIVGRLWRPVLAALFMAAVVSLMKKVGINSLVLRLFCNVVTGGVAFFVSLLVLWLISGRLPGAERMLVEQTSAAARRVSVLTLERVRLICGRA